MSDWPRPMPSEYNMPPGVTTSMIPGNRPEDEAEERFWQTLEERCDAEELNSDVPDELTRVIEIARDIGYDLGVIDARADAELAEAERHAETAEQGVFDQEVEL